MPRVERPVLGQVQPQRRLVAVLTGNFNDWGLPDAARPSAAPGAEERADAQARAAEARRKRRPRRRPARFAGDD